MKRFAQILFSAAIVALPLWSCNDPSGIDSGRKPNNNGGSGVKPSNLEADSEWIYDRLCESYYWLDAVRDKSPKAGLAPQDFLDDLLTDLPGAQDNTENPPTIDGYYTSDGARHIYSYVDLIPTGTRAVQGTELTFGFGFQPFWADATKTRFELLVTWVQPDGPAENAGLHRGMWIDEYNGGTISYNDYVTIFDQVYNLKGSHTMNLTDQQGVSYPLQAVEMKVTPVIYHDVITSPQLGTKVAYLVYSHFEPGANSEFDNQLRSVFADFKANGATELVLDLRYNPGGYVTSCQLLTSLAGDVTSSRIFAKLQYNKAITTNNPEILHYLDEPVSNCLKLDKIYILETGHSASAAEMVISSLRGNLGDGGVIHIGETTNGKNVGMDRIPSGNTPVVFDGYEYQLWPITFKIKNAKDFCNYAGGFTPDYRIDEFRHRDNNGQISVLDFGDPNEELLNAALKLIDGGSPVVDPVTRAGDDMRVSMPFVSNRGGARVIRDENGVLVL